VKTPPVYLRQALAAVLFASLCACSKPADTTHDTAAQNRDGPCAYVTQAEMRAILYAPVAAHVSGGNKCVYALPSGPGPYSQVEVVFTTVARRL
jgi:hypothetical protein